MHCGGREPFSEELIFELSYVWDKRKLTRQRRKKKHLSLQETLDIRENQLSLRGCHVGAAIISQDVVQAIKERSFTQIGFGVRLHLWVSRYKSEFSDPALPLGGE